MSKRLIYRMSNVNAGRKVACYPTLRPKGLPDCFRDRHSPFRRYPCAILSGLFQRTAVRRSFV